MKKNNIPLFPNRQLISSQVPNDCAPRSELIKLFRKASKDRVIYVDGPAGSGKTVSAHLWIRKSERKPAWIVLGRCDNTPDIFYRRMAYGIFSLYPNNEAMGSLVASPDFSSSPVEHVIRLIGEIPPNTGMYALVFDNMHLITNVEIAKSLPIVLKYLPFAFVTIILSRHQIPKELFVLIQNRETDIIGTCNLRFSPNEIKRHFKNMGHSLSDGNAAAIYKATDGWAMGVDCLAKRDTPFFHKNEGFHEYFERLLWDGWDELLRDFCLRTSIVDEFTPQLASALTGREDASKIVENLCHTNAFLRCTQNETYRYHPLFHGFLQERFSQSSLDTVRLCKIAADYYKEQEDYTKSLYFRLESGDYGGMADDLLLFLCENHWRSAEDFGDFPAPFFATPFPDRAYEELPALHILSAWYYYLTGQYKKYSVHMDIIIHSLHSIALINSRFIECAILVFTVDYRLSIKEKVQKYEMFSRFVKEYTSEGPVFSIFSCSHNMPYMHRGNLDCSELALDEGLMNKIGETFGLLPDTKWAYIHPAITACLMYERNQLESALNQNILASDLIKEDNPIDGRICVEVLRHSILWRSGSSYSTHADDTLAALTGLVTGQAQFFLPSLNAYKTKLRLLDGDSAAAKEWFTNDFTADTEHVDVFHIFQHFTTARAYSILGKTKEALRCLLVLEDYSRNLNRPLDEAEAQVLLSAILWAEGLRPEAIDKLTCALALMQPFGFIRVIADEGTAVLPILKRIKSDLDREGDCPPDMRTYLNEVTLAAYSMSKHCRGILPRKERTKPLKLSRQQKNMLVYYSQGYKNADIARMTGLSIPTIKAHASLAYKKLGVNNALDAVLKARELKII